MVSAPALAMSVIMSTKSRPVVGPKIVGMAL